MASFEPTFTEFGKIGRMNRPMTITEKIDGENGKVSIRKISPDQLSETPWSPSLSWTYVGSHDAVYAVWAQSRTRVVPINDDPSGFAAWVRDNALELVALLGEGDHSGEWWGYKIKRGYGLKERKFSLFNTARFDRYTMQDVIEGLDVVPVLHEGPFSTEEVSRWAGILKAVGSYAAEDYDRPEGLMVYHHGLSNYMKVTLENDEKPKSKGND